MSRLVESRRKVGEREKQRPQSKDESPRTDPLWFVTFFSEVRDEHDDDHDREVVAARDETGAGACQVEAALQRRGDDVHDAVDRHSLSDGKDTDE